MKYIFCLLSFFCLTVSAQEIQFTAEVNPASVPKGEAFNLTYTLNAAGSNLRLPSLPDFDVLTPQPSTGRSSFSSNINGAWQESTTYTYRYTLRSKKEGTFTIPAATVTVGGKQYSSNTVTMRVGGQAQSSTGSSQSSGLEAYEDIFMRLMPSKTTVYEQEAIFLNYKLFSAKGNFIRWGNNVKFPDTKGFIAQEIELDANAQWMPETYNGRQYLAVSAKQQILQAQQAGTLEIGKGSFEAQMAIPVVMHGMIVSRQAVNKSFTSAPVKITVKPLPAGKPASFAGAVGDFRLKSEITPKELKANQSFTLKITISGSGNIKLFKNPEVNFPASFERYEPKVDNRITVSSSGVSGSRTIEYLTIPRSEGKFVIPPVQFGFFNPQTGKYQTLTTPEYTVNVQKGDPNAPSVIVNNGQMNVEQLASDIRHIKTGDNVKLNLKRSVFFGSAGFWLAYLVPFLLAVVLFVFFKKKINRNADMVAMRRKRATKQALKRLKTADKFRRENNEKAFCDELLKALWGYLSDKLNIPLSQLNKDNIEAQLRDANTSDTLIAQLIDTLQTAEMIRYAPSQAIGKMDELYEQTLEIMKNQELGTKNQESKRQGLGSWFLTLGSWFLVLSVFGNPLTDANALYTEGKFVEAAEAYENLRETAGDAPELYYNLGNAWFKQSQWAKAILNYERALLLAPNDDDARANLALAQSRITDRIVSNEGFFSNFWNVRTANLMSANAWAWASVLSFCAVLLCVFAFFFGNHILRQVSFFAFFVLLAVSVLTFSLAGQQSAKITERNAAIIMTQSISVKSSPDAAGTDLFILHEGTKVQIQTSLNNWVEIRLADGKIGWLPVEVLERI